MNRLEEKTIATTPIFEGKIISLQIDEVELPDGTLGRREIVKHPGAVAVIPFTKDGRMVLVRQYRKALGKVIAEIPAGKLEPNENPLACAARELEEETGFKAHELNFVTSFYTSPGFADEIIHLYEANELEEGQSQPDADEFVEMITITLEQGLAMLEKQEIHDAKTAFALLYWQTKKNNEATRG